MTNAADAAADSNHAPRAQDDQQALRDRAEHAIRARLVKAWPLLADEAWIDQAAAMAAVAAVETLLSKIGDATCPCESYDCAGECCGIGNCSCTPALGDPHPRGGVGLNIANGSHR